MAISRKEEARALDADERELVEQSHHPAVRSVSDKELSDLLKLVRGRRDKAKTQAQQRRREMRGKAQPKGAAPSASDTGSKQKLAVLAMAVRRLNSEAQRRSAGRRLGG
jgi:hypothetical protein